MSNQEFFTFIDTQLKSGNETVLLYVLDSEGSSPGRQGFRMAVCMDGQMKGSIGGGIMEHKLVEQARTMLKEKDSTVYSRKQIHSKAAPKFQSGMICSGEQWVAIYYLNIQRAASISNLVNELNKGNTGQLVLNTQSIFFQAETASGKRYYFYVEDETNWTYREQLTRRNLLYIIGGGHVGLAFSRLMATMDFYIHIIDNREGLNTMIDNNFAQEKHCVSYDEIAKLIPEGDHVYVALMSFGYRTDKMVLAALLGKHFRYLGMMGARAKVDQLFRELKAEGYPDAAIEKVYAPIGIPIASKTPEEIAVSIAAEIIRVKNQPAKQ